MRSRLAMVPRGRAERVAALLEELEAVAADLTGAEALEVIGRAARLDAVLRTRLATVAAPSVPVDGSRYLDATAAATYLGVSRSTVIRLKRAGSLPCFRPSEGIVRFDREALDRFMGES